MKNKLKNIVQRYNTLLAYRQEYKTDFDIITLRDTMIVFLIMVFVFFLFGKWTNQLDNFNFIVLSTQTIVLGTYSMYLWILYSKLNLQLKNKMQISQNIIFDTFLFALPFLFGQTAYFYIYLSNYINSYLYLSEAILVIIIWIIVNLLRGLFDDNKRNTRFITNSLFVFVIFAYGAYIWNLYNVEIAFIINALTVIILMIIRARLEFGKTDHWPMKGKIYRPLIMTIIIAAALFLTLRNEEAFLKVDAYDALYNKKLIGSDPNITQQLELEFDDAAIAFYNTFYFNGMYYCFGDLGTFTNNYFYPYIYDSDFNYVERNYLGDYFLTWKYMFMANGSIYAMKKIDNVLTTSYFELYKLGSDNLFYYVMDLGTDYYGLNSIYLIESDSDLLYMNFKEDYSLIQTSPAEETYLSVCNADGCVVYSESDFDENEIIYQGMEYAIYTKNGLLQLSSNHRTPATNIRYIDGTIFVLNGTNLESYLIEDYLLENEPIFTYDFSNYENFRQFVSLRIAMIIDDNYVLQTVGHYGNTFVFSKSGELKCAFADDYLYIDDNITILSLYDDLHVKYDYYVLDSNNLGDLVYEKNGDYRDPSLYLVAIALSIFAIIDTNIANVVIQTFKKYW